MKIVDVPKAIKVAVKSGGEIELEFADWLQGALDCYEPLGKGAKACRQSIKLNAILDEQKAKLPTQDNKNVLRFEDADFDVVKAACEAMAWNPAVNRRSGEFWSALEKAQDVKA